MGSRSTHAFVMFAVVTALALPAGAQSVISTRSGVIHFFEGAVYLAGQPLESRLGKFPCIAEGAELRTAQGRAEILLTPGVFLRIGESSAIRMLANGLSDTHVELLAGSAIVDAAEPGSDTSVTLSYRDWKLHFLEQGVYRIDAEPPRLWVRRGLAEVTAAVAGEPVSVPQGMYLPLAAVLVPERSADEPRDALADWASGRSDSIAADNTITAQIGEDPASQSFDPGMDSFTYFPFLGVPSLGLGSSRPYISIFPYQPGFNSIYLPGYTYRPWFWGLSPGRYRIPLYTSPYTPYTPPYSPPRTGGFPGTHTPSPTSPTHIPHPVPSHSGGGVHGHR